MRERELELMINEQALRTVTALFTLAQFVGFVKTIARQQVDPNTKLDCYGLLSAAQYLARPAFVPTAWNVGLLSFKLL
jgi:hypothetical protein